MTAVELSRAAPFNNPLSGAAYDAEILGGYRGSSRSSRPIPLWPDRSRLEALAGQVPELDLDFTQQFIVDRIGGINPTFTRAGSTKLAWDGTQFQSYAADVPAFQLAADGVWEYLHEPAATNRYLNSNAPATQGITVTAQQYTLSFYGTGTLTLSGASTAGPLVGTGAEPNRVSLTFTPSAGSLTVTLSGSISKPQLETGPVATSPIITAGSAATRTSDVMTIDGANGLALAAALSSSFWTYVEGTCFSSVSSAVRTFISADDNTANERWRVGADGLGSGNMLSLDGGTLQAAINYGAGSWPLGSNRSIATSFATNNFRGIVTGGVQGSDLSGTLPTVTQFKIGAAVSISQIPALAIRRITLFPGIPSDATLSAVVN
jgi:hypothetical protein